MVDVSETENCKCCFLEFLLKSNFFFFSIDCTLDKRRQKFVADTRKMDVFLDLAKLRQNAAFKK